MRRATFCHPPHLHPGSRLEIFVRLILLASAAARWIQSLNRHVIGLARGVRGKRWRRKSEQNCRGTVDEWRWSRRVEAGNHRMTRCRVANNPISTNYSSRGEFNGGKKRWKDSRRFCITLRQHANLIYLSFRIFIFFIVVFLFQFLICIHDGFDQRRAFFSRRYVN